MRRNVSTANTATATPMLLATSALRRSRGREHQDERKPKSANQQYACFTQ